MTTTSRALRWTTRQPDRSSIRQLPPRLTTLSSRLRSIGRDIDPLLCLYKSCNPSPSIRHTEIESSRQRHTASRTRGDCSWDTPQSSIRMPAPSPSSSRTAVAINGT